MLKASLVAVLVYVAVVHAQLFDGYVPTFMESGELNRFAQINTAINNRCSLYAVRAPAGTGAVQIDITYPSGATGSLALTAGLNYYPTSYSDTTDKGQATLLRVSSISSGARTGRYYICTYDSLNAINSFYAPSTTTSADGSDCAAYVPDLFVGGTVYVCLSALTTGTVSYGGIQLTLTNKPATVVNGDNVNTLNASPAVSTALWGTTQIKEITAYRIDVTTNTTSIKVTPSSSDVTFAAIGFGTTSSQRSYGEINANRPYYAYLFSKTASAATITYTPTNSVCVPPEYPMTSALRCVPTLAGQASNNMTYARLPCTNSFCHYRAYTFTVPAASATGSPFYTLNVTTLTRAIYGQIYFSGYSYKGMDSKVNPNFQLGMGESYSSTQGPSYVARYLVPGTQVQVSFYYSFSDVPADYYNLFTAVFTQEAGNSLVIGTAITEAGTTVTSAAETGKRYYLAAPLTSTGKNGYTITVKMATGANIERVQVVSKDFSRAIASTVSGSSGIISFNVPSTFLTQDTYYVVADPANTNPNSYMFSFKTTSAINSATTAFVSAATIVIACIALFF